MTCMSMTAYSSPTLEQRVDQLYDSMSRAERVAQLRSIYISALLTPEGKIDEAKCKELIPDGIGLYPNSPWIWECRPMSSATG